MFCLHFSLKVDQILEHLELQSWNLLFKLELEI